MTPLKAVPALALALLLSCGTDDGGACAGSCYLVGDYTEEEARALTDVTRAIVDAGIVEPGYAVSFVHDPNASFKQTTWKEWRVGGIHPTDPSVGYGGWCDRPWCMVFINRCGSKRPFLHSLLIHEIMHAAGYDHGAEMKAAENRVWEEMK